ncbi:G-type lectin S-receptor-like serine/threonine-protein kinase At1g67520 [Magnolia sinica]|uniref:G-type lectin S-receptor-like serine/threonine-protein kinase At1g67520 n=1 Tax=Magnolia sinica TaxID=86752 RepID=UPI002657B988|nr:G-type lectin S-receptor-like serine/threonine-protein kinase At1g67520 [Magnolia sinica]
MERAQDPHQMVLELSRLIFQCKWNRSSWAPIRCLGPELSGLRERLRKKKRLKPPLVVLVVAISILLGSSFLLAAFICYRRRRKLRLQAQRETSQEVLLFELGRNIAAANKFRDANNLRRNGTNDSDLKLFSFATISAATDNFSAANELGQGGFGPVYKGKLLGGQEIAVKRLSRSSGQGLEEFKNEIILIAKLQHMNLVRLFGCSIERDEKILIYEYMPNKSLDSFLFGLSH